MVEKKDKKKPSKKKVKKQVENKNIKKQVQNKKGMKQSQTVIVNLGKKGGKSSAPRTAPTPKPPIIINPTISIPYYIPQMEKVAPENIKIQEPVAPVESVASVAPIREKKPNIKVTPVAPIRERKPKIKITPVVSIREKKPNIEVAPVEQVVSVEPVAPVAPVEPVAPVTSVKEKKPKREVPIAMPIEEELEEYVKGNTPIFAGKAVNAPRRGRPPNTDVQNAIARERRNELARQRRAIAKQRKAEEIIRMEVQEI